MTEFIESEQIQILVKPNIHELPENWHLTKLDDVTKRGTGHTPDKEKPEYYNGGIKWVSLADSNKLDNLYLSNTTIEVSSEGIRKSSAVLHPAGTVVLSRDAGVGKSAIISESMAVSQHFVTWTCGDKIDATFLYYKLQQLKPLFERMAVGSTIKTIGLPFFKKLSIPLPPIAQQRKIAAILSTWDEAIVTARQLLKAKQERKRGLMQHLLTGQKRLPGFSGEWLEVHFSDMLREVKRPVKWNDDEVYNLLSVRRRSGGVFFRESLQGHEILTQNLRTAKTGEFLISKMQIVHGASGLVREEHDGMKISGSYIAVVSRDSDLLDIEFFDWYSQLKSFYRLCYTSSYGVHIEKMTFDFADFLKRKISIPPTVAEQRAITAVLNATNEEIRLATAEVQALQQQKRGVMQELLTGNKLVTVDE